ncbi:MAG: PAS domain S-box protein [Cyanobacteria bacterium P01_A01_bin.37]
MSPDITSSAAIALSLVPMQNMVMVAPVMPALEAIAHMSKQCSRHAEPHASPHPTNPSVSDHHPNPSASCVVVVDEDCVVGILTERDVVRLIAQHYSLEQVPIRDVMTSPVTTARQSELTDVWSAIRLLQQHHISHLPMVDEGDRPIGLLTHESLLQTLHAAYQGHDHNSDEPSVQTTDIPLKSSVHQPSSSIQKQPTPIEILLLESEQRYQSLVSTVPVGIMRTDAAGHCVYVNNRWCQISGLSTEAAMDHGWMQGIHPEDRERISVEWHQSAQKNCPFQLSYRFQRPDGLVTWVYSQSVVEWDVNGQFMGYVGTITDIKELEAERQQIEWERQEAEAKYRAIYNNALEGIYQKTVEGRYLTVNPALVQMYGYETPEALLTELTDIRTQLYVHPEDRDEFHRLIEEHGGVTDFEVEVYRKDGTIIWISQSGQLVKDEQGCPLYYEGTVSDISDRKRIELSLQQTTQILQAFLDHSPACVSLFNAEGRYVQVNPAFADMLEVSEFEIVGRTFAELLPKPTADIFRRRLQNLIETRQPLRVEDNIVINNALKTYESILFSVADSQEAPAIFAAIAIDITDRKQTEAALRLSEQTNRTIIETIPDLLIQMKQDGTQIFMTGGSNVRVKYPSNVAVGDEFNVSAAMPPDLTQQRLYYADQALSRRNAVQVYEQRVEFEDEKRYEEVRVAALPDQNDVLVIVRDITERKQAEAQLQNLIVGTATTMGQEFFPALVKHIAQTFGADYAIATERVDGNLNTIAFWADGALQPNFSYHVVNTPCEKALQDGVLYCERSIQQQFPEDLDLVEMDAESYLGVALLNSQGEPIGNLCVLHRQLLQHPQQARQILQIFAARAGAELERQRATTQLEQLNQDLEAQVRERTKELALAQSAIDIAAEAVLMIRKDSSFVYVNRAACDMSGYSRHELLTLSFSDLDKDCTEESWKKHGLTENQHRPSIFESSHRAKDGRIYPVEVSASFLRIDGVEFVLAFVRDITHRKNNERERQQLIQELSDFKFAFDQAAIFAITDPKGVITHVNDRFCELSGYSKDELIGQTHRLVNAGYHPPSFFKDLWQTISHGNIWQGEICNRTKEGKLYWMSSTFVPLLNDQKQPSQYLAIRFDITDRKQAEQIIQHQANREKLLKEIGQQVNQSLTLKTIFDRACRDLRHLMQAERVSIFEFDSDSGFKQGTFIAESVLESFSSILGTSAQDQCFGDNFVNLYKQGRYFVAEDIYQRNLSDCHVAILNQFQIRANLVVPICKNNELLGLLCIHHCTQPWAWQKSEITLVQQVANQLAIAIQQVDLYQQLQQELADRHEAQQQLTERNQELAISNEELARATRLKDEFLANMSHELRTPLNAILGMAEGLAENVFGEVNQRQLRSLQTIYRSGSHLLELINDILDIAKIESGHIELSLAPASIELLCKASLLFIKQQALQKGIQITTKIPANLPNVLVDERRIRQVLINLLTNAVKFTPERGHVTLEASHRQIPANSEDKNAPPQNFVRIAITDTGIGIAPENMGTLFQPFRQIDSALNRNYNGTGLGLALVKQLTILHGGHVEVTSDVGVGSCFVIELPCARQHHALLRLTSDNAQTNKGLNVSDNDQSKGPFLILLVEDNEANITTISSYLRAKDYRVVVARNGSEAITSVQAEIPDVILMDIQMPEMNGLDAMKYIRHELHLRDLPIIALTALTMPGDRERFLKAGATDYLSKPVTLKHLTTLIQSFLKP